MAAGRIIIPNVMPALDINGNPVSGAKLTFYVNETTTLLPVYTTSALNVAHPNPVSANSAGAFPSIFADTAVSYSVAITDADNAPITGLRNRDNVQASVFYGDDVVADTEAAQAASEAAQGLSEDARDAAAADAVATAADRVQTGLDVVATNADVVLTAADAIATAADRVQTGLDASATAADAIATAADRVQTGLDRVQTGADVVSAAAVLASSALKANNLSDLASASTARDNLGLTIGTNVQAYDADLTTWAGITPGTGVGAALAINVGSAGAFTTFNGAGGTPLSLTLTNATGLPGTSVIYTPAGTGAVAGDIQTVVRRTGRTPEDFGAVGDGVADDTAELQLWLNAGGLLHAAGLYKFSSTLTISQNNTAIIFAQGSKLTWAGGTTGNLIQDISATTPASSVQGLYIEGLELDGATFATGDSHGVNFYRVGNLTMKRCKLYNFGSSGLRWGNSYIDTVNVYLEDILIYNCRTGDAFQGSGRNVVHRRCVAGIEGAASGGFGDTGLALLRDMDGTTNPSALTSSDVLFEDCVAYGNWDSTRTFIGTSNNNQTGFAFGPFDVGRDANIRMVRCKMRNCYVNGFFSVYDNMLIEDCDFGYHGANDTGNIVVEGVTRLRLIGSNKIAVRHASGGSGYCALRLQGSAFTYGASRFDANLDDLFVDGLFIKSDVAVPGIMLEFAAEFTTPTYQGKVQRAYFGANRFIGCSVPYQFSPSNGNGTDICDDVEIAGSVCASTATAFATFAGAVAQYKDTRLIFNKVPASVSLLTGTGAEAVQLKHKLNTSVSALTGTATTIFTLPEGYEPTKITAWVKANSTAFTSEATIRRNGNAAGVIGTSSAGANLAITMSTLNIQVNQTTGGTNTVHAAIEIG